MNLMYQQSKKFYSFFKSQIIQIHEGGVSVFYLKTKRLFKSLYMEFIAPLAVYFNMRWPCAYRFVGIKLFNKYKMLRTQSDVNQVLVKNVEEKMISCCEKYIAYKPDLSKVKEWIDVNHCLSAVIFGIPKIESIHKCRAISRRVENVRQEIAKTNQLDELGVGFVPRSIAEGSLGVYENLESYLKAIELGMAPAKRLILLVDPNSAINNPCYLKYWSRLVTVISDPRLIEMLAPLENCLTAPLFSFFTHYDEKVLVMYAALGMVREQWIKQQRPPLLNISNEDKERGWECLRSFGVPRGAWFVGLHVREPGWRDSNSVGGNHRNADVRNYFQAIKSVTATGGWVIRLGDPVSMTPLPAMDKVIDYAHSNSKSDWMDVFLCSQCRFLIGTASGVYTVSQAFGVPTVMTNFMAPYNMFALTSQDLFLSKLCVRKDKSRKLTFKELVSPPIGVASYQYDDLGIEAIENTPEEIKGAVEEMMGRLDGTLEYTEEDEYLQNEFKSNVKDCVELYGDKDINVYARIGRDFIRKHASLLSLEEVRC